MTVVLFMKPYGNIFFYTDVESVRVIPKKGWAFVKVCDDENCRSAIEAMRGVTLASEDGTEYLMTLSKANGYSI
jgi:RNA recognition motif-containing protein